MSISSTTTTASFVGNNSTSTPYPLTGINYIDSTHVKVYADGIDISNICTFADGTDGTGSFTTNPAKAATVAIEVFLTPDLDQPVSLQETGSLPAKTLENQGFDRLNMQIRWLARRVANCFTLGNTEDASSTGTADNLLGFDGSGDIAEIPNTTFEPAKGVDDNFVTDAEKVVIAATSNTNTGDQVIPVSTVDFDPVATDNSTDVTKAGTGTYVSLDTGTQVLTVDPIDEADLNASINASLDLADTSIQSLASIEGNTILSTAATVGQVLQSDGDTTCSFVDLIGGGNAQTANPLSQFAATTSAQLAGVISDETGTGALVLATSPTLVTPALGTPSAVDLTNATNYPETNGTVQGTGATTLNIVAADEGAFASTTVRGEGSVDLQTNRNAVTQVAGGVGSVLIGGEDCTAAGDKSACIGGFNNSASGANSICLSGRDSDADANFTLTAGNEAKCGGFAGARVFGDSSGTAITAIQADEFTIQGSTLRLIEGNQGVGKVLTSDGSGRGNWAALPVANTTTEGVVELATQAEVDAGTDTSRVVTPETLAAYRGGISVASYYFEGTNTTSTSFSAVVALTEEYDGDGIGTVSSGIVTLGAGTYKIDYSGDFLEDEVSAGTTDYFNVEIRQNNVAVRSHRVNNADAGTYAAETRRNVSGCVVITSASSQNVTFYHDEPVGTSVLYYQNVSMVFTKLA